MRVLIERCNFWPSGSGSVLVSDGLIERVSRSESQQVSPETTRIDAAGGTLLPGLVDSHCHPFELGWLRRNVDLRGTSNITALRMRVAARAQRAGPGEWIQGMGWDHELFPEGRMPTRFDLDDLTPNNPVILSRVCGHIALLNTKAIESLRLGNASGPEYQTDESKRLTGIIMERALVDAYAGVPGSSASDCAADLAGVEYEAAKNGLACLHSIMSPDGYREEMDALVLLAREQRLLVRHRVYVPPDALELVDETNAKLSGSSARICGVKLFADGSLGARTAALREPYSDEPGNLGLLRYSDEELAGLVGKADSSGVQVMIHAIGDRAVEQAVGALEAVTGGGNPRSHRIEHASLLPRDLRGRIKKHGIRLAVQPSFIVSDTWAEKRLGPERVRDLYPLKSILREGIVASSGSDSPVESLSVIMGIWAAMAGRPSLPSESLELAEAVATYTRNADLNGLESPSSIQEGGVAQLTLLDSAISGMHPALLRKVSVAATISGGQLAYSSFEQ